MYAVGQGAMAVETRSDDASMNQLLLPLNDPDTLLCCVAERAFLHDLGGGCSVPVGTYSAVQNGSLEMEGAVFSLSGSEVVKDSVVVPLPENHATLPLQEWYSLSEKAGSGLARRLLDRGAGPILARAREVGLAM